MLNHPFLTLINLRRGLIDKKRKRKNPKVGELKMRKEMSCMVRMPRMRKFNGRVVDVFDSPMVDWMVEQEEIRSMLLNFAMESKLLFMDPETKEYFPSETDLRKAKEKLNIIKLENRKKRFEKKHHEIISQFHAKVDEHLKPFPRDGITLTKMKELMGVTFPTIKRWVEWSDKYECTTNGRRTHVVKIGTAPKQEKKQPTKQDLDRIKKVTLEVFRDNQKQGRVLATKFMAEFLVIMARSQFSKIPVDEMTATDKLLVDRKIRPHVEKMGDSVIRNARERFELQYRFVLDEDKIFVIDTQEEEVSNKNFLADF